MTLRIPSALIFCLSLRPHLIQDISVALPMLWNNTEVWGSDLSCGINGKLIYDMENVSFEPRVNVKDLVYVRDMLNLFFIAHISVSTCWIVALPGQARVSTVSWP